MSGRALAWAGSFALFAVLYGGITWAGLAVDEAVGAPRLPSGVAVLGLVLLAFGVAVLAWCFVLFARRRGTPNPVAPPQALVTEGPYAWMRNPIAGSHALALLGIALILGSASMAALVLVLGIPVRFLMKLEERSLEARFGDAYRAYRARVPAWIPRPPRRQS